MTTDRRKAILFLSLTLIIGIFIGTLVPAVFGRFTHRGGPQGMEWNKRMQGREGRPAAGKGQWLTHVLIRVVKPDSDQVKVIRPLTEAATKQISELEENSNARMATIMDSLKLKLKPILTEDQNKKLEAFSTKARSRWREKR